jgi:hypothetical protein
VEELVKFLGSVEDMPKQRPGPGSPAKGPHEGYHFEEPFVVRERKWVVHSVACDEEEQENDESCDDDDDEVLSKEACVEDELFSGEGEDEILES